MSNFLVDLGSWLGAISSFAILIFGVALLIGKSMKRNLKKPKIAFFISIAAFVLSIVLLFGSFFTYSNNDEATSSKPANTKTSDTTAKKADTNSDTPITKEQYQKIKIGMTKDQVKGIVDESKDKVVDSWYYSNPNYSYAEITFDEKTKKVKEKSEDGILSSDSETITDKNGTRNDKSSTDSSDNDDYVDYVQMDIEDAIGSKVDWVNGKKIKTVKKVEINDNAGKNDGSKLILVYLNAPVKATNNMIKTMVNEDTLKITKVLTEDSTSLDFKKDSITYFWYLPLTDKYGKTSSSEAYKISLENATLNKIDYKHLSNVDLPSVADQYNVLYKE